jgi:peptidoglycan/LPS O-acetylase OafA/YrhL
MSVHARSRRLVEAAARTAGVGAIIVTAWLVWSNRLNRVFSPQVTASGAIGCALTYTIIALAFGAIVVEAARQASPVRRVSGIAPLRLLGKYSYGIYVFQGLLAPVLARSMHELVSRAATSDAAAYLYFLICTLVAVLAAVISWHVYEQRFLKWKRFFPRDERAEQDAKAGDILNGVRDR